MKKFFRLFFGRFFWFGLIILIEVILFIAFFVILETLFSIDPIIYAIAGLLFNAIALIVMIYIIWSSKNSSYKISWLFIIGLVPYFGIILYILFANKNQLSKRQKKKIAPFLEANKVLNAPQNIIDELKKYPDGYKAIHMSNYISKVSRTGIYNNTSAKYFSLGDDAFPFILEELKKARHYIFMEYFIIAKGKMWNSILDILKIKAQEGVDVRVIYDDVGSISYLPASYPKQLQKFGIKCYAFNKFRPLMDIRMNNRDHRKILVIDGFTGFTGGINLADEYINAYERFGHWKDNCIMLKGKAVQELTKMFLATYGAITNDLSEINQLKYCYNYYIKEDSFTLFDGYINPYSDIPFDDISLGQKVYLSIINQAENYVYITTPYLILDEEMENALINASLRGVKVIILTPHIPDKKLVYQVTRSYYQKLINSGVKIFEYTPGFIHSKMFISDENVGTIGTINLDYRSLYLHLENGIYLYRSKAIKDMKEDFLNTLKVSEEITPIKYRAIKKYKTLYWTILRLFAPML